MKLAYLAGPYRAPDIDGIARNIWAARSVACQLWAMGFAVICPHTNSAFMDGVVPPETFLKGDLEMVRRCDLLVVLPGYENSSGTRGEIQEAHDNLIPIYYWPDDEDILREDANE